ncbi:MAG: DUF4287 domain-containing protein [Chloroflexota bacterium]|nr:DUF4287 domain-containing protein [Chloroflexota bacterium]
MSFQAYLDSIEKKTGHTPREFIEMARARGYDETTKAGIIVDWLKDDFELGRGHAMALVHLITNGPQISDKHVGTDGVHRDESDVLYLDGIAAREAGAREAGS